MSPFIHESIVIRVSWLSKCLSCARRRLSAILPSVKFLHPMLSCSSAATLKPVDIQSKLALRHKLQHVWMSIVVFHPLHKFIDASLEESFPFTAVAHVEVGRVLLDFVAVWAS